MSAAEKIAPPLAIERFRFQGDDLDVVHTDDGDVAVPLRELCDAIGIDANSQRKKLAVAAWASTVIITVQLSGDTQSREILCLSRRSIPLWAATIHATKVRADVRDKLVAYQRECADVLADHFLGKRGPSVALAVVAPPSPEIAQLTASIGALTDMVKTMNLGVLGRIAALESAAMQAPGGTLHTGTIGGVQGGVIRARLRNIATAKCAPHVDAPDYKTRLKRERSRLDMRLRLRAEHYGYKASWDEMPADPIKVARVDAFLADAMHEAVHSSGPAAMTRVRLEETGQQPIKFTPK